MPGSAGSNDAPAGSGEPPAGDPGEGAAGDPSGDTPSEGDPPKGDPPKADPPDGDPPGELTYVEPEGPDCAPDDPWATTGAEEICGDWVDDNCDGSDGACPESGPGVTVPTWDCLGDPPANVYAWARFAPAAPHYDDGLCFVFFQADSGAFFVDPRFVNPLSSVVCGSWDERLYAYTLDPDAMPCEEIFIDSQWEFENPPPEQATQPVSNECRKFLHSMTFGGDFTFMAMEENAIARRLALYPTLEIACTGYNIYPYPWKSLLEAPIQTNPGFVGL